MADFEYAIIVKNKTRLETLIDHFNTKAQAKFYIESKGGDFTDYEMEHEQFVQSMTSVQTQLSSLMKHKTIDRQYVPSYLFSKKNLIIVVGQDGLVANTAKYSQGLPIIAVNPDPDRYDGILLPFRTENFLGGVDNVLSKRHRLEIKRFAEARLHDGQRILAFNDLFIGVSSHISARYRISYSGKSEEQSSSGLIVSTKAGSTGWLSSLFNMAYGVTAMFEKDQALKQPKLTDNQLLFVVREPFKSQRSQIGIATGIINEKKKLMIESFMPRSGVIFSDGIESDYLAFNSGTMATIGLSPETAHMVMA